MSLDNFFYPASIAIVGASEDPGKAGFQITKNLLNLNFPGDLFFVNPKSETIHGHRCYQNLQEIEKRVELLVIVVPAFSVPNIMQAAAQRGDIQAAIILASGFSETRIPARINLEEEVLSIAGEAGIRVIGPNCVGVMNTENQLDTTFAPNIRQLPGGMSIISQSGSLGASILMFAGDQPVPIGFSKWAHVGNMSDVDLLDILQYYQKDAASKVIAIYMEGVDNARGFIEAAREVSSEKPIIVLKVGKSETGSAAAASHTGSLAGADKIYDGAFVQSGITRVNTIEELIDTAKAMSMQPLPAGNKICVLTEAGGPGIIAMDEIGLAPETELAKFSEETISKLKEILPPMALIGQPDGYIDMSAAADEGQHAAALEIVLEDQGVDGVVLLSVPPTFLKPDLLGKVIADKGEIAQQHKKPVLVNLLAGNWVKAARENLESANIPTFNMPEQAARVMINMVKRSSYLQQLADRGGV